MAVSFSGASKVVIPASVPLYLSSGVILHFNFRSFLENNSFVRVNYKHFVIFMEFEV